MVSESVNGGAGVLPWSSLKMSIVAMPRVEPLRTMPSRASLISTRVPVKTIRASVVPSPVEKVRSPISAALRVRTPLVTLRVTSRSLAPTSGSATTTRLPLAALKVRELAGKVVWGSFVKLVLLFMLLTGGSLIGVTLIVTVS